LEEQISFLIALDVSSFLKEDPSIGQCKNLLGKLFRMAKRRPGKVEEIGHAIACNMR